MGVHPRAVVHEQRLRHERDGLAGLVGRVLDDVLVLHDVVGGREQRVVAHVDLGLARGADLVVVHLDRDAHLLEVRTMSVRRSWYLFTGGSAK